MLTIKINNQIALVTLDRPDKRNAINIDMFKAISRACKKLRANTDVRVIIVNGNGEDFCSGLDVKSVLNNSSSLLTLMTKLWPGNANLAQQVSYLWRKIPVPVIFALHGRCWGGGLQIALGGDFRYASEETTFSVMEGKWGLIPDMGGNLAIREIVTRDIALKLAMTAEVISAQQALAYGLITKVCDDPLVQAYQLAEQLKQRNPDALAACKTLYHKLWCSSNWRWLATESWYQIKVILGKNQKIAVQRQLKPEQEIKYLSRKYWWK